MNYRVDESLCLWIVGMVLKAEGDWQCCHNRTFQSLIYSCSIVGAIHCLDISQAYYTGPKNGHSLLRTFVDCLSYLMTALLPIL